MKKTKKLLLKKGEGDHSHIIESPNTLEYEYLPGDLEVLSLNIPVKSKVTHEEHAPIIPKKGHYYVVSQQEYDPLIGDFRSVFD